MSFPSDAHKARDVFEILVRENADMLSAYLHSSVDDESAVDDLFQETMIVAWKRLADFDRSRPFGPWLRGIARNLVLAHYRSKRKLPVWYSAETLDAIEARFQDLFARSNRSFGEQAEDLFSCIQRLSERLRSIIEMIYARDMSSSQVAHALGEQESTVRKRAQRARTQLYDCLRAARSQQ